MPPASLPGPSPLVRRAKVVMALAALLTLVPASLLAAHVLSDRPWTPVTSPGYRFVEKGDGWFAYSELHAFTGDYVTASWSANSDVDRMMLVRNGDVDRILSGEKPSEVLREWELGGRDWRRFSLGDWDHGNIEFAMPASHCPPPTGGCVPESRPVMVWLRGDDWVGTPRRALTFASLDYQEDGAIGGDGPVLFRQAVVDDNLYVLTPWYAGTAALLVLVATGAGAVWALAARRAPRQEPPLASPFQDVGAAEMLRLVRLAELYVATISRYFLLSAAFIVLATGLVMFLALPPLLAASSAHFLFAASRESMATWTFVLVPLFLAAVGGVFWAVQLREVRRELARWRRFSRGLDERAAAILGS